MSRMKSWITRREAVSRLSIIPVAGFVATMPTIRSARAAEFELKYANQVPMTHPLSLRVQEAAGRIATKTSGRVQIRLFPNNQLGGDNDMLSQIRSGGITFYSPSSLILAPLVQVAQINTVGFAFSSYDQVWCAMDGKLGSYVRDAIAKLGLFAFEKVWDNGFRQITTSSKRIDSVNDIDGLKIRVPVTPIAVSMFKALGAAPAGLQFSEVYSALQTRVVDAQENPLPIIQIAKLYEVQKYCAISNHIWDGFWLLAHGRTWSGIPADIKVIISDAFNEAAVLQREDLKKLNETTQSELVAKGLVINQPDRDSFVKKLRESGYYAEWKRRFGEEAWSILEGSVGKLV